MSKWLRIEINLSDKGCKLIVEYPDDDPEFRGKISFYVRAVVNDFLKLEYAAHNLPFIVGNETKKAEFITGFIKAAYQAEKVLNQALAEHGYTYRGNVEPDWIKFQYTVRGSNCNYRFSGHLVWVRKAATK